jgi:predicted 2-oxoglutarate/Fe(II)-dependent dioxygenase YbiX
VLVPVKDARRRCDGGESGSDSDSDSDDVNAPSASKTVPREADAKKKKRKKRKRRTKIYVWKLCGDDAIKWRPDGEDQYKVSKATPSHRTFMVLESVLSADDIAFLHKTPSHPAAVDCNDRHKKLEFKHQVHRIERALKQDESGLGGEIYYRLLRMMTWADEQLWGKLAKKTKVYPEVEYISYDATGGEPQHIEPHVDNDSVVTVVVALSDPKDYTGGTSMFKGAGGGMPDRGMVLGRGDAVFFRGESLLHWITPVTDGFRAILQIELSKK